MKRILVFNFALVFLSVVSFSVESYNDDLYTPVEDYDPGIETVPDQEIQDYQYHHEQESVNSYQQPSQNVNQNQNKYSVPTSLHPIYIRVVQDAEAIRERDNLKISIGIPNRQKRERKFTRFNSTIPPLINPSLNTTVAKGVTLPITAPKIYNVTIIPRPVPFHEPLIMVRNLTKSFTRSKKGPVATSTRTSITAVKNITSSLLKGKPAQKHPPQPLLPPTGDVTEEEDDDDEEDEEEEDDASQGESGESQDSSEENEEEDESEKEKPSKPQNDVKQPEATTIKPFILIPSTNTTTSPIVNTVPLPTKGDTGSSESIEDDADKKKKKKAKKKKKKKGKKKAELHFVPAPLGTKADIIVRLDKVHKNVREIFSVVKGVFKDYVIKRPHVNIEFYSKGLGSQHDQSEKSNDDHGRSDIHKFVNPKPQDSQPWNPPSWSKNYPEKKPNKRQKNHQSTFSKRFLEDECLDDEICDEVEYQPQHQHQHQPQRPNKGKPIHLSRVQLPYPIYLETRADDSAEYSPFDDLPPLPPSYFKPNKKAEQTWIRTWDKKKTGLPQIADSAEASKRTKHKHHRH